MAIAPLGAGLGSVPNPSGLVLAASPPQALSSLIFQEDRVVFGAAGILEIAPPSPDRVYLAFYWPSGANNVWAVVTRSLAGTTQGVFINQAQPLILNWSNNASTVNQQWWGNATAAGNLLRHQIFYRPQGIVSPTGNGALEGDCK